MAIGDTSIIKDANGVNITVKDIASDYLIEQADGTYHRENHRTEASQVEGVCPSITFGRSTDVVGDNGGWAAWNKTLDQTGYAKDTSLIALDGTTPKIKKAGRYLVMFSVYLKHGGSEIIGVQGRLQIVRSGAALTQFETISGGSHGYNACLHAVGQVSFKENDSVAVYFNAHGGTAGQTNQSYITFIYLGEQ